MGSPPYAAVMLATVVVLGANVTLQLPADNVHVVAENVPAPPVLVNVTVPVGTVAPAPFVSATVAVHEDD